MDNVRQLCLDLTIEIENQYQGLSAKHSSGLINKLKCRNRLVNIIAQIARATGIEYSVPIVPVAYADAYDFAIQYLSRFRDSGQAPTIDEINKANEKKGVGRVMTRAHFDCVEVEQPTTETKHQEITVIVSGRNTIKCWRAAGSKEMFYGNLNGPILNQITLLVDCGMVSGKFTSVIGGIEMEMIGTGISIAPPLPT